MDKGVSIFTPTYNRAYILPKLYESLKKQTCGEFEWIIVDDGSTDGTKQIIETYIKEEKITIRYYYQENSGKHIAHNLGVREARKMLFTCVDSDDYLTENAVQCILETEKEAKDCIGIVFARGYTEEKPITRWKNKVKRATLYDAYHKYGLRGDTMLIYRTDIIKNYYFPQFEREKFVPEAYLYDQLDSIGKLYIKGKIIYICNYLSDGYTVSMKKVICRNPNGYREYIKQRICIDKRWYYKLTDVIRYVSISFVLKEYKMWSTINPVLLFFAYFPGWILYRIKYKKSLETNE